MPMGKELKAGITADGPAFVLLSLLGAFHTCMSTRFQTILIRCPSSTAFESASDSLQQVYHL